MYKLVITLFIVVLIFGCSQEQEAEETASTTTRAEETMTSSDASTVKDKVSDSEYSKKYGAAMKEAMGAKEEESSEEGQ